MDDRWIDRQTVIKSALRICLQATRRKGLPYAGTRKAEEKAGLG